MDIYVVKKKVKLYGLAKGKAAGFADGKAAGFTDGKAVGFADGKATGFADGKTVGFADGVKEVAKALKETGMDIHEISKITGLSIKELENL